MNNVINIFESKNAVSEFWCLRYYGLQDPTFRAKFIKKFHQADYDYLIAYLMKHHKNRKFHQGYSATIYKLVGKN